VRCDVFLSYTRVKDEYGAVEHFRDHLEVELRKKTGDVALTIFQDTRVIHGGDRWQEILLRQLADARLLLVLLSPTWIRSPWCRREYEEFCKPSAHRSTIRPIVPIMWDTVEDADATSPDEEKTLGELRAHQVLAWGDLQYRAWTSPKLNRSAGKLAEEIKRKLRTP
jgi:hypothetical protein